MSKPPAPSGTSGAPKPASDDSKSPAEKQPSAPPTEPGHGPALVPPTNESKGETIPPNDSSKTMPEVVDEQVAKNDGPQRRTAFFRADAAPATVPPVSLSHRHAELCKVKVGDMMPDIKLPQLDGKADVQLADKYGEKATVVVFWKSDRRMSHQELADLGPDVIEPFGKNGVSVVGIVVNENAESAQAALTKVGAEFTNLLDADGKAFAQVGANRLPRTFLLDSQGKILWFDLEYSAATRRDLRQALRAVTGLDGDAASPQPSLDKTAPVEPAASKPPGGITK